MIIATRELTLREGSGDRKIIIRLFTPELQSSGEWGCRYEIDWPGSPRAMTILGIDSAQALVLALQIIGVEIYSSSYHKTGNLFFGEPGSGYGFPVMSSMRDLLQGDDKKFF